jgi:hypothetical protein
LLQVLRGGAPGINATDDGATRLQPSPKPELAGAGRLLAAPTPPELVVAEKLAHAAPSDAPSLIVKAHATANPTTANAGKQEPHIGLQDPHATNVLATQEQQQVPQFKDVVKDMVSPTPVERMVKHFAQVLRTAEVVPSGGVVVKLAPQPMRKSANGAEPSISSKVAAGAARKEQRTIVQSAATKLAASDEQTHAGTTAHTRAKVTRATVQSAAKEVAEQLAVAEAAQEKARVLDRKAAEQRANATVLAKFTTQEALNAGAAAAHKKASDLLQRISRLEDSAERAQIRSSALHSKAKLETEEASELMMVADHALNQAPPKFT